MTDRVHEAPLVVASEVTVRFPAGRHRVVHAVEGVSFDIRHGETLALVGESGSGKTTLGFTILRRYTPVHGRIMFDGRDVAALSDRELRRARRDMQIVFQNPYASLNPRMKVVDIVSEPLLVHGVERRGRELQERTAALLERCGLRAGSMSKYPAAFSGGQRQRIAIARALALQPKLIVADEAVSALDVSIQAQIINLMIDLQEQLGVAYLFISHDLAVVRNIAHRVAILYAGKLMEIGPTDAVFGVSKHPYTHALLAAAPIPDPKIERSRPRIVLRGEVPSVLEAPSGCVFRTRCPLAVPECVEQPPLVEVSPFRQVACWRSDAVATLPGSAPADAPGTRSLV